MFKDTIGERIKKHINVKYAFQPLYIKGVSKKRMKPLGTAHALVSINKYIKDKFLLITADDFYGFNSFRIASELLEKEYSKLDTLEDIRLGYAWQLSRESNQIVEFVPNWFIKIDHRWKTLEEVLLPTLEQGGDNDGF